MEKIGSYAQRFLNIETISYLKRKKSFLEKVPDHFLNTNSLFIHVPKAAGISIVKSLYDLSDSNHDRWIDCYRRNRFFYENSYKFSFVRDPGDRLISAYNYLSNGGRRNSDIYWHDKYLKKAVDIEDFILNGYLDVAIRGGAEHFTPQWEYILDKKGVLKVDFVGRFETIDSDFLHVSNNVLGYPMHLPKLNASVKISDKTSAVNNICDLSNRAILKIKNIYSKDYRSFDY